MSLILKLKDYIKFSDSEIAVAKYIVENLRNIKGLNATEIAKNTYTSNSTITRLCKKVGFDNFQDFKIALLEESFLLNEKELEFKKSDVENELNTEEIIEKINKINVLALQETKLLQNPEVIDDIIKEIEKKEVLDLYGLDESYIVCLDCQYKFNRVGKVCNLFNGKEQMFIQAINSNKEHHTAILVSYSGFSKEMIDIAKILESNGVTTISITKNNDNSLAKFCKYNLFVGSKEESERTTEIFSRTSMLNIVDILYITYYKKSYLK